MNALCEVKEAKHNGSHFVLFHLYVTYRIDNPKEAESGLVVASDGWEDGGMGSDCLIGIEFVFLGDENILELDKDGGCTFSVNKMPHNCIHFKCLMSCYVNCTSKNFLK